MYPSCLIKKLNFISSFMNKFLLCNHFSVINMTRLGSYSHFISLFFCNINLLRVNISKLLSLPYHIPSHCHIIFFIYGTSVTYILVLCRLFFRWSENIFGIKKKLMYLDIILFYMCQPWLLSCLLEEYLTFLSKYTDIS